MRFILIAELALACLATAMPSKRQSTTNIVVELSSAITSEKYDASSDGTTVYVESTFVFNKVTLSCSQVCIEYHCELWDKELNFVKSVNPGATDLDPSTRIAQFTCRSGLAADTATPESGYKARRQIESAEHTT